MARSFSHKAARSAFPDIIDRLVHATAHLATEEHDRLGFESGVINRLALPHEAWGSLSSRTALYVGLRLGARSAERAYETKAFDDLLPQEIIDEELEIVLSIMRDATEPARMHKLRRSATPMPDPLAEASKIARDTAAEAGVLDELEDASSDDDDEEAN